MLVYLSQFNRHRFNLVKSISLWSSFPVTLNTSFQPKREGGRVKQETKYAVTIAYSLKVNNQKGVQSKRCVFVCEGVFKA